MTLLSTILTCPSGRYSTMPLLNARTSCNAAPARRLIRTAVARDSTVRGWVIAGLSPFCPLCGLAPPDRPMLSMGHTDILTMVGSDDPLYNLRQVEQLLANHFTYTWFDPMTQYLWEARSTGPVIYLYFRICLPDCRCRDAPGNHQHLPSCARCNGCSDHCPDVLCREERGDWKTAPSGCGFYCCCFGTVFLPVPVRLFRSPHRGSALFNVILFGVPVYPPVREGCKDRS